MSTLRQQETEKQHSQYKPRLERLLYEEVEVALETLNLDRRYDPTLKIGACRCKACRLVRRERKEGVT